MKIKNILVSQPKPDSNKSPYYDIAGKYKVNVDFFKFFRIEGLAAKDFRKSKINILDYTAIIFSSKNAVDNFFRLCEELRIAMPDSMKYFCTTKSIAFYLQKYIQYRKRKIFYGKEGVEDLVVIINKKKEDKYLLPCSEGSMQEISGILEKHKIVYTKAVIYYSIPNNLTSIDFKKYDMLVLFSPYGVESLFKNFPKFKQGNTLIAVFGSTTAKAVRGAGLRLDVEAPTVKAPSMAMAIEQYLQKVNKK